jgi:hypothetical protein
MIRFARYGAIYLVCSSFAAFCVGVGLQAWIMLGH